MKFVHMYFVLKKKYVNAEKGIVITCCDLTTAA